MFAYIISDPKMDISPSSERGLVILYCKFEEALYAISIQTFDFVCAKRWGKRYGEEFMAKGVFIELGSRCCVGCFTSKSIGSKP